MGLWVGRVRCCVFVVMRGCCGAWLPRCVVAAVVAGTGGRGRSGAGFWLRLGCARVCLF